MSIYSSPNEALLKDSQNTVWSCEYQGDEALKVIDIRAITAVVAMVPFPGPGVLQGKVFVVEKPSLDVAHLGGNDEYVHDE